MDIGGICTREVVTASPGEELLDAAARMRSGHVGYLVVTEPVRGGSGVRPVGVLSDRDIVVTVVSRQADPAQLRVSDVMSGDPVTVGEHASVKTALGLMRKHAVRRLPVTAEDGRLVGVLSVDDLLAALTEGLQDIVDAVRAEPAVEGALRG